MLSKKKFKTPLYGQVFYIVVYDNDDDFEEFSEKNNAPVQIKEHDGAVWGNNGIFYVFFTSDKKGYPTPGIIAHEAKHLVNNIFIEIGHKLDLYNDEPEAYLLMWIVNRIHEFLNSIK